MRAMLLLILVSPGAWGETIDMLCEFKDSDTLDYRGNKDPEVGRIGKHRRLMIDNVNRTISWGKYDQTVYYWDEAKNGLIKFGQRAEMPNELPDGWVGFTWLHKHTLMLSDFSINSAIAGISEYQCRVLPKL